MNTFKKTTLYSALAGIGALGMAGTASAVHVNPNGLGQVLIYPYYTVNAQAVGKPFSSLLSVVNSTASAKAVKVRFLEGKNSVEVLDFNLYLSPHDVWTTAVLRMPGATATGAGIITADKSCTYPAVSTDANNPTPFTNVAYAGDGGGDGLDRTREGYVEIIEMGNVTGTTAAAVTHSGGVPPSCGSVASPANDTTVQNNTVQGNGGLFGGISLINVLTGEDVTADAVALESWRLTGPIWFPPGVTAPDLTNGAPPVTEIFNGTTATTYTFATEIDAVSAALMHNTLMNEYVLDTATKSGTDWVVTFPTKKFYVSGSTASPPFQNAFTGVSCDDIGVTTYDREERNVTVQGGFSPPTPGSPLSLCYEANVITFNSSNVLGSVNFRDIDAAKLPTSAQNGWAVLDFTKNVSGSTVTAHRLTSVNPVATFNGLPVIGFMAQTFVNDVLAVGPLNVQSNYGGNFVHKTTTLIN